MQIWSREKFRGMTCFIGWSKGYPAERQEQLQEDDKSVRYSKRILSMCRQSRSFEKYDVENQIQNSMKSETNPNKCFKNVPYQDMNLTSNCSIITEV